MHKTILRRNQGFAQMSTRRDVAPRADHLDSIASLVAYQLQLIADPAIVAVFLAEAILVGDMPLLEQTPHAALDAVQVLGVNAGLPELRARQVLLGLVAQEILHVLADERRRVVARRLETVDHCRRAGDKVLEALPRRLQGIFGHLARCDVAPRADHLGRLAALVADEAQL